MVAFRNMEPSPGKPNGSGMMHVGLRPTIVCIATTITEAGPRLALLYGLSQGLSAAPRYSDWILAIHFPGFNPFSPHSIF